jgi:hypothetical protein
LPQAASGAIWPVRWLQAALKAVGLFSRTVAAVKQARLVSFRPVRAQSFAVLWLSARQRKQCRHC